MSRAQAPMDGPWSELRGTPRALRAVGEPLYRAGDAVSAVYLVEAGCVKTVTFDGDGGEQVRGFHFPGELVGLDALGAKAFPSSALTVTPALVRRLPLAEVLARAQDEPELMRALLDRVGDHLRRALAWGGDHSADARVAAFLLTIRTRMGGAKALHLPMTRRDIANHLRLATETVCRVLRRFESRGWIVNANRRLTLEQPAALHRLAVGLEGLPALAGGAAEAA